MAEKNTPDQPAAARVAAQVEYVLRVALPTHDSLPDDQQNEVALWAAIRTAILAQLPDGFEVCWGAFSTWPKDREGLTWVPCRCVDEKRVLAHYIDQCRKLHGVIECFKQFARQILKEC